MIKKIVGGVLLATLTAGSICGVVYGCKYNDLNNSTAVQEHEAMKTEIDSLNSSIKKLEMANIDLGIEINVLKQDVEDKKGQIETLEIEKETLIEEKTTLQNKYDLLVVENGELNDEVVNLESEISSLESVIISKTEEIAELQSTIEQNEETIATLTTERDNLSAELAAIEEELAAMTEENDDNLVRISILEQKLLEAENEVTRLEGLISSYEEFSKVSYEVSFYADGVNLKTEAVKNGEFVTELPSTDGLLLKYWTLEDGTQVDPLTYSISANTTFYAVLYEAAGYNVLCDTSMVNGWTDSAGKCFPGFINQIPNMPYSVWGNSYRTTLLPNMSGDEANCPEKFYIEVVGYFEVSENTNSSMPFNTTILDNLYLSDSVINNSEEWGETSSLNYTKMNSIMIEFNKTGYSDNCGIYSGNGVGNFTLSISNTSTEMSFNLNGTYGLLLQYYV